MSLIEVLAERHMFEPVGAAGDPTVDFISSFGSTRLCLILFLAGVSKRSGEC